MEHSGFRRTWHRPRKAAGRPSPHFHDLRHIGNTPAASTGASLKELMARMGHSSTRAALIYQHAGQDRDEPSPRRSEARSKQHGKRRSRVLVARSHRKAP
ncbi:tyrosine-type recombinase/integrase, partial [Streptomyces anulatus]|uniref:tyrosine-type recombinase/integrase n=1 Tax=Streptomyces anulatus TaxID=1892 RepID=UPI003F4E3A3A